MQFLRRVLVGTLVTIALLLLGLISINILCRSQPTQKVRIELREAKDRFGTPRVDVYLTNLTSKKMEFDESLPMDLGDAYGGIWYLSSTERILPLNGFVVEWWRADVELEKKHHIQIDCTLRGVPTHEIAPGEKKRIASVYVTSKYSKPWVTTFQLGYQPGRELEQYPKLELLQNGLLDWFSDYLPLHHVLLSRKTYWSNPVNIVPVKQSEIKGIDSD